MSTHSLVRSLTLPVAVLAACSILPASAFARGHSSHSVGARGGTLTRQVERSPGAVDKNTTYTSPKGKITTDTASRRVDRTTGTVTSDRKTQFADGSTATRQSVTQKTDTGRTTHAEATHRNGTTSTYDATTTRTDNGHTRHAVATGPNGGTTTKDITVAKTDGVTTRTETVTRTPPPAPAP